MLDKTGLTTLEKSIYKTFTRNTPVIPAAPRLVKQVRRGYQLLVEHGRDGSGKSSEARGGVSRKLWGRILGHACNRQLPIYTEGAG